MIEQAHQVVGGATATETVLTALRLFVRHRMRPSRGSPTPRRS
ncbi:hypothetical protein IU510_06860 [Nocardia cyriacigeorgica]|nr:hypothetical protein [Nocardia cyriacigeorgica]MBF6161560.1 hypothetical protein [Nocardia cyriacigeorgica]MBF6200358.1 hypothetical protein [Nocardia cyriacigeorgica]MBF6316278.1 hypothetical protein [Nocardia cyriacigeorgica]MBF6342176.1 hypothetical protein [Nocardia cyriacigeorgica]